MLDVDSYIAMHATREQNKVIFAADIISLYADPINWDRYYIIVDEQLGLSYVDAGSNFSDDHT